jgi:hypothetical protein
VALALALALAPAAGALAQEPPPPPPHKAQPAKSPEREPRKEHLSDEDKALVRELALLEKVELLQNLELFEPARRTKGQSKTSPQ